VAAEQFPSNYYAWDRLAKAKNAVVRSIGVADGPNKAQRWNTALLEAINERTAAVALSHIHWAEGCLYDLPALRAKTRAVGAWLIVDGTQSVGALPFDQRKIQADALVCGGYKWLMGPYATALAYYGPAMDNGVPIEENWINRKGSQDFRNLVHYQDAYQPLAGRYSVGEQSNFVLLPMLEAALQQLIAWEPARIQAYCATLNAPYLERLKSLGFKIAPAQERSHHLLGVQLPNELSMDMVQTALQRANVLVSMRGQSIRISPNVYNNTEDWERLTAALEQIATAKST
ncbi:MAG: aminotransferase class V-fold PLP-dependent enzyme, partial [Bacteroidota bacterium]